MPSGSSLSADKRKKEGHPCSLPLRGVLTFTSRVKERRGGGEKTRQWTEKTWSVVCYLLAIGLMKKGGPDPRACGTAKEKEELLLRA